MTFNLDEHIPENLPDTSKVWVYQANRLFLISEAYTIEDMLANFLKEWKSHGAPVKGFANLFFGRFIVLIADETNVTVGGCSTDSSVRFIKEIEQKLGVNMFDRELLAFYLKDKVEMIPMSQLQYAIDNGFIKEDTLYFNNTVQNLKDLKEKWIVPAGNSWLQRYFNKAKAV